MMIRNLTAHFVADTNDSPWETIKHVAMKLAHGNGDGEQLTIELADQFALDVARLLASKGRACV